jgi:methionyl aminopeptidase
MTLCIEPMINRGTHQVTIDADGWTVRTADRLPSAHYEHMVVVRVGRAEVLSSYVEIEAALVQAGLPIPTAESETRTLLTPAEAVHG